MECVEGDRANSKIFIDHANFLYRINNKRGDKKYLKCVLGTCSARVVCSGSIINHTEPHNHSNDPDKTMELKFKEALRRRSRKSDSCDTLKNIYDKCLEDFKDIASTIIKPYKSYKDLMARAHKEGTPKVPNSFDELNDALLDTR